MSRCAVIRTSRLAAAARRRSLARSGRSGWLACAAVVSWLVVPATVLSQTRYLAFGDSITEGVGDTEPLGPDSGYPGRLRNLLPEDTVENHGLSGEDTAEGLSRLPQVLLDGGDVLLLMEGTNDVERLAPEDTLFNLRQMARMAESNGMTVVQATIIPRVPNANRDPSNQATRFLVQELRNAIGFSGRQMVDPHEAFTALDRMYSEYYWQEPEDRTGHPNANGYDVMARAFADVLQGVDSAPPVNGTTDPTDGTYQVPNGQSVRVDLWDFGTGMDLANTRLLINGQESPARPEGDERFATILHRSDPPLRGRIELRLQTQDQAAPPNVFDREIGTYFTRGTNFPDADFDRNGRVDGRDLIRLAEAFASRAGDEEYYAPADLDGDGTVDGNDLALFAGSFGARAE